VLLVVSSFAVAAVNINTATKEQLDALPGIGPVKAQAIVDYRTANGPFKTPADIMKVRGIKEGEFAKIKDQIAVSGVTSTAAPAAPAKAEPKTAPPGAAPSATPAPAATPAPPAMSKGDETKTAKEKAKEERLKKAADAKAAKEKIRAERAEKAEKARMAKEQSAKEKSTSDKDAKAAKDTSTKDKASADTTKDKDKTTK
jgi:competence protein ComEA